MSDFASGAILTGIGFVLGVVGGTAIERDVISEAVAKQFCQPLCEYPEDTAIAKFVSNSKFECYCIAPVRRVEK